MRRKTLTMRTRRGRTVGAGADSGGIVPDMSGAAGRKYLEMRTEASPLVMKETARVTKAPEDEAVEEAGAGALAEAAAAGSVAGSEEAGAGEDSETAAEASGASGEDVRPSEREVLEAREEEDSEEREEVKAALNSTKKI